MATRKYFDNLKDYHANKNAERNEGPLNDAQKTFFADQSAKQLAKQQATIDKIKAGKHWMYKGNEGVKQYTKSKQRNILGMAKGGAVKSASSRADGCAVRGKTRAGNKR